MTTEMKPCPFCGGVLEPVAFDYWGHPQNDCFLQAMRLASSGVGWWNARASAPPVGEGVSEKARSLINRAHNAIGSGKYDRATVKEWLAEADRLLSEKE